jgi:cytochrome c553
MTKLQQVEQSIEALSDAEIKELAAWFEGLRWQGPAAGGGRCCWQVGQSWERSMG